MEVAVTIGILLVIVVLIANAVSFTVVRLFLARTRGLAARALYRNKGKTGEGPAYYFIAGNLNQPVAAFESFLMQAPDGEEPILDPDQGNYIFMEFQPEGFSAKATADWIANDIQWMNYEKVIVFTISLGDHVARYLEQALGEHIKVHAINPCPIFFTLKIKWIILLAIAAPLLEILCHALGWLSMIPIIPTAGGRYSLVLLADQYLTMIYDLPPNCTRQTKIMLRSKRDVFLNNGYLVEMFPLAAKATIDTAHGDTIGAAEVYRAALKTLLEKIKRKEKQLS